jgi:hypothetical protein
MPSLSPPFPVLYRHGRISPPFRYSYQTTVTGTQTLSKSQQDIVAQQETRGAIMAEYQGEYGHPYPRVDQYGNPVPPVDQYGNPLPREPASGFGAIAPPYSAGDSAAGHVAAPVEYGADAKYPHDGTGSGGGGGVTAPTGVVAYSSGGVAPAETALASYEEGMVHLQPTGEEHTFGMASQLQPTHGEEHTFGMASQLQPTGEEHTTLGEKLRRSGSSSSVR